MTQRQVVRLILALVVNLHDHIIYQKGLVSVGPGGVDLLNIEGKDVVSYVE